MARGKFESIPCIVPKSRSHRKTFSLDSSTTFKSGLGYFPHGKYQYMATYRGRHVKTEEWMRHEKHIVEPRYILEAVQLVCKPRDHPREGKEWLHLAS
jgi:hypothetical protein